MASLLPCAPSLIDAFLSVPSRDAVEAASQIDGPVGVLGAGGKMGLHMAVMLRRALDEAGRREVPVVAVSRFGSQDAKEPFLRFGVETLPADLLDDDDLAGLPDFRTVYFMAGIKFGTSVRTDALKIYNEEMPEKVARRFASARIVAFSTGCVYPFVAPESGGSTEEDETGPTGDYAVSCLSREKAFAAASARYGTPVVLIRLNYAVEFRYGVLVDVAQRVMSGEPVDVSMGHVNVIWQRDAVDHILRAAQLARSPATVLNVAGLPIITVRELARRFGEIFGREPIITGSEEPTAWLNNPAKAHRLYGEPEVNIDQAIVWTAAWLQSGGATLGKPTKFERRDGKF